MSNFEDEMFKHLMLIHNLVLVVPIIILITLTANKNDELVTSQNDIRSILSLEDKIAEYENFNWNNRKWLNDFVEENYSSDLPKEPIKFWLNANKESISAEYQLSTRDMWFVSFNYDSKVNDKNIDYGNPISSNKLSEWSISDWEKFWNACRLAAITIIDTSDNTDTFSHISNKWIKTNMTLKKPLYKVNTKIDGFLTDYPNEEFNYILPRKKDINILGAYSFLDMHSLSSTGKTDLELSVIKTQKVKIDLQSYLTKSAKATWLNGGFEFSFPQLYKVTHNMKSLSLKEVNLEIQKTILEKNQQDKVTIIGIDVFTNTISIVGVIFIVSLQLYFLLHLSFALKQITTNWFTIKYPWIGVYPDMLSRTTVIFTSTLIPLGITLYIVIDYLNTYQFSFWSLIILILSSFSLVISFFSIKKLIKAT